jgi:hypothetical protein
MLRRARYVVFDHDESFSFWFSEEEAFAWVQAIGGHIEPIPKVDIKQEKADRAERLEEEALESEV